MVQFLRDIIAIPSESSQEEEVIKRIKEEMEKVGFDEVIIDPMGNVLGRIGNGSIILATDSAGSISSMKIRLNQSASSSPNRLTASCGVVIEDEWN